MSVGEPWETDDGATAQKENKAEAEGRRPDHDPFNDANVFSISAAPDSVRDVLRSSACQHE
jgi:hypothetical protein